MKTIFAALILISISGISEARVNGTDPGNDTWCEGPGAYENCIDAAGDFIPTTTGTHTLGTAALYWGAAYITGINNTGNISNTGNITIGGKTTYTNTGVTLSSGTGVVPYTATYQLITVTGNSDLYLTAAQQVATGATTAGSIIILSTIGTRTVEFRDASIATNSGLQLGSTNRTIGQYDTLTLVYDGTFWDEIAFSAN